MPMLWIAVLLLGLTGPLAEPAVAAQVAGGQATGTAAEDQPPAESGRLVGLPQPVVGEPVFDSAAGPLDPFAGQGLAADPFAGQGLAADPFAGSLAASSADGRGGNPSATVFGED